ncbi:hypothetical protein BDB00DRAFT_618631 [Zychaea mexicana]|uniref:uncharacterized protein n=1 Tax=Zychaea mexicana TaxID=64656 RepID=UPI0022FE45E8|nr:uncharacterized protein BDB00DRAFT_618631 [Zychaea mexicana]KAI9489353.1 hypothetical protein BDB00DRAFT_618631 [Zychaea mexicana]
MSAAGEDIKALLQDLLAQEERCQFTKFTSDDALKLGLLILENAKAYTRPIVLDINLAGHQLFHFAMQGTGPDNNEWVARKNKAVLRFRHSSYYLGRYCASQNKTLEEKYYVSEKEYACHGGSFPLIIKDVGVVGTITVSGLAQQDDHGLVVKSIEQFLGQ